MPEFILDLGDDGADAYHALDSFTQGYIEAMFFTNTGDKEDECTGLTFSDMAPQFLKECIDDCTRYQAEQAALLAEAYEREGYDDERAGRDFWFTRCGHGVGFWDRDPLRADGLGDRLSETVGFKTAYPQVDIYKGDDGKIYGS